LVTSFALGREVAALLDVDKAVPGVTSRRIRPELRSMGSIQKKGGDPLDTGGNDLAVVAGWGRKDNRGAVMPGAGKDEERDYTTEELEAVRAGAEALSVSEEEAFSLLGRTTHDVYLNDDVYWKNVPDCVWTYRIGGHQVIKKWLSYREQRVSGRRLSVAEVEEVTRMVRRIAALLLLEPRLDHNYGAVSRAFYPWPRQTMTKDSYHVIPDPDGGWSVRKGGSAQASKHFETKKRAVSSAQEMSNRTSFELVIHRNDGTIERIDSYGKDPFLPPG
jgi:hypothetical protein